MSLSIFKPTRYSNVIRLFGVILFAFTCGAAQEKNETLRTELLAMRDRDQAAREQCSKLNAAEQMKCYVKISEEIDKPNTQRLEAIVMKWGVPEAKVVGPEGVAAYFLVLQHSQSFGLKKRSLSGIKKAFKARVLPAMDYANFTDRLLVNLGKPQIYGSNFDFKDGKLVMSPTKDLRNLDRRRAKLGLPPIAEYARVLKEMYKLDVVIPQ